MDNTEGFESASQKLNAYAKKSIGDQVRDIADPQALYCYKESDNQIKLNSPEAISALSIVLTPLF